MPQNTTVFSSTQRLAAWLVHLFTASGALFGLFALVAIHEGQFITAFWLMAVTIFIDAFDGLLARKAQTKAAADGIDGELLDNIVDYFTYVIVPAFFLLVAPNMLPKGWAIIPITVMVLASAYQFSQLQAKTEDHFFTGFPSYWNIVVFYLYFWNTSPWVNALIILILAIFVFVPIKYVYPSRLQYLTPNRWLRYGFFAVTLLWGAATLGMLIVYPESNPLFVAVSMGYAIFYALLSVYRTLVPVDEALIKEKEPKNR